MANVHTISRRIAGVQNMARITRAMELIAISKMRQTQRADLDGRPYAEKIQQVIADLAALSQETGYIPPLLKRRSNINRIAVVLITPDRGLNGGLHTAVNRIATKFISEQEAPVTVIAVGCQGAEHMSHYGEHILAEFSRLGDLPRLSDTLPISRIIVEDYTGGVFDAAYLVYARFVSTVTQTPVIQQVLPLEPASTARTNRREFIFEPSVKAVLGRLLHSFVEMEVYHAVLENAASEHSARAVAMQSATESANDLVQELTLRRNKARQESITEELLDITSGANAAV